MMHGNTKLKVIDSVALITEQQKSWWELKMKTVRISRVLHILQALYRSMAVNHQEFPWKVS